MYCTNCGKETNINNKFCKYCGNNIENDEYQDEIIDSNTEEMSTKYYDFFSKYFLRIITIINIIGFANYQDVLVWDIYAWLELLLDIILFVVAPLKLLYDMQKPTGFTYKLLMSFLLLNYIYRVIKVSLITYSQYMESSLISYIIISIGLFGFWYIPNIVYFKKRRYIFKD